MLSSTPPNAPSGPPISGIAAPISCILPEPKITASPNVDSAPTAPLTAVTAKPSNPLAARLDADPRSSTSVEVPSISSPKSFTFFVGNAPPPLLGPLVPPVDPPFAFPPMTFTNSCRVLSEAAFIASTVPTPGMSTITFAIN